MDNFEIDNTNPKNENDTYNNNDRTDFLKDSPFYTETHKKTNNKKSNSLFQLVLVALISSIFGGLVVASLFMFVTPLVQPSVKSYFEKMVSGKVNSNNLTSSNDASGAYKKIEILKSDSPVTAIAEKVSPSIVGIRVTFKAQNFFLESQDGKAEGSGIIIKDNGYIMTNYHVIENVLNNSGKLANGGKIEVILPNQKDKPYSAQIVGGDSRTDLAVLKIDATGLPAAELGNSDELKIGELAVAIGNPAGLEYMGSVTVGVISGLNRTIPIAENKELKLIQTDAAINPGNSGGALLNSRGQVIGVNTAKMGGQGFEGLGFAIPINKVKEITSSLIEYTYVKGRPYLGIGVDLTYTEEVAKQYNYPAGILVKSVEPLSGAYKAGIQAGDVITRFDGQQLKTFDKLEELKNKHKPEDVVKVEFYRDGESKTVDVKLVEDKR